MTDSTAPIQKSVLSMPDEHYYRMRHEIERSRHPLTITNPQGRTVTFRISKGMLIGYEDTPTGRIRHEVMRESVLHQRFGAQANQLSEKDKLKLLLKRDRPEATEAEIEYQADIIIEGRKSMLALINAGVPADKAKDLIQHSMRMSREDIRSAIAQIATERGVPVPDISGSDVA